MATNIIYKSEKKTIYLDNDKIIKCYNASSDISLILNEALNLAKVYKAGLNVSNVHEVKNYNDGIGIVMDYIEGQSLLDLIKNNKKNLTQYINVFANTQHDIFAKEDLSLNNSYEKIKNKIFASDLPATIKYNLFYRLREMEFAHDIIHGDYNLSNVIITKDKTPYIIDWSHAAFGNKKFDIAVTYVLFDIKHENEMADIYLDSICKLESIDKELIFRFIILAYIYIVDRYNEETKKDIYDKVFGLLKKEEA